MGASSSPLPLQGESILAAGGDCKALPAALSGEYQQLSQEALAQCYPQAPQDRSQACRKTKTHNKDCESRTERRKEVKFWNFSYFIFGS